MSYIKNRIEKNRAEDETYRAAFDEEVELLARERERRERIMSRVVAARKAKHFTQHSVAEAMKISQARVSQLESGAETLSIDNFLQMLEVLDLRLVLLTEEDAKKHGLENLSG